jgi:Tfp pilus assembly protein PilN
MRAVNLLPREAHAGRSIPKIDPVVAGGTAAALLVSCAIGAGWYSAHSRASSEAQSLATAQAVLAGVPAPEPPKKNSKPIIPVPAVTAEQQPRLDAVSGVLGSRTAWDRVLREFAQIVPRDVTVSGLTMDGPVTTPSSSGTTVSSPGDFALTGTTTSHDGVARLLARLMLVPDLTNVSLANSTASPDAGVVAFTINAVVRGAGA